MARTTSRRVNYRYLARLQERLLMLGYDIKDWPLHITEATWDHHRDYIKSELHLSYCVRCKLPILLEDCDDAFTDICKTHAETLRDAIQARVDRSFERRVGTVDLRALRIASMRAGVQRPDKPFVAISKPDPSTIDTEMPIDALFNKLNKRS
jgi:hypothetical protein